MLNTKTHELINVPLSRAFAAELATVLPRLGYSNRSDFIRQAIIEKLRRDGIDVPASYAAAPSRMKARIDRIAEDPHQPPQQITVGDPVETKLAAALLIEVKGRRSRKN